MSTLTADQQKLLSDAHSQLADAHTRTMRAERLIIQAIGTNWPPLYDACIDDAVIDLTILQHYIEHLLLQ